VALAPKQQVMDIGEQSLYQLENPLEVKSVHEQPGRSSSDATRADDQSEPADPFKADIERDAAQPQQSEFASKAPSPSPPSSNADLLFSPSTLYTLPYMRAATLFSSFWLVVIIAAVMGYWGSITLPGVGEAQGFVFFAVLFGCSHVAIVIMGIFAGLCLPSWMTKWWSVDFLVMVAVACAIVWGPQSTAAANGAAAD
jgi:hypothetical protein